MILLSGAGAGPAPLLGSTHLAVPGGDVGVGVLEHAGEHVEVDADGMHVTPVGRLLVRNVCMLFDAYLSPRAAEAPRFSRTV